MQRRVFISHSSKDRRAADVVVRILEGRGVPCWIAPRDIVPGTNYPAEVVSAIGSAGALVLIHTPHSNASQQVMREVERAASKGVPIIPFRLEDVVPARELELFTGSAHWLDATGGTIEEGAARLAEAVRALGVRYRPAESTGSSVHAGVPPTASAGVKRSSGGYRGRVLLTSALVLAVGLGTVFAVYRLSPQRTVQPTPAELRARAQWNLDTLARFAREPWFSWYPDLYLGFVNRSAYTDWLNDFRPSAAMQNELNELRAPAAKAPNAHNPGKPDEEWPNTIQLTDADFLALKRLQQTVQVEAREQGIPEAEIADKAAVRTKRD